MEDQIKEKKQVKHGKTLTLTGIPSAVNNRLKEYQRDISFKRGKKFNLKTAYVEFLKEVTTNKKETE